jgi:hypothetical protein
MSEYAPAELCQVIRERAVHRCAYRLLRDGDAFFLREPDHIIAIKHRSVTGEGNLACTVAVHCTETGAELREETC